MRRRRRAPGRPRAPRCPSTTGPRPGTVIEVRADDEPGLVYTIARTLAQLGLDISLAKIATEKSQALDVFYVTDGRGRRSPRETSARVEAALLVALGGRRRSVLKEAE